MGRQHWSGGSVSDSPVLELDSVVGSVVVVGSVDVDASVVSASVVSLVVGSVVVVGSVDVVGSVVVSVVVAVVVCVVVSVVDIVVDIVVVGSVSVSVSVPVAGVSSPPHAVSASASTELFQ
jgi:hypothetical protein